MQTQVTEPVELSIDDAAKILLRYYRNPAEIKPEETILAAKNRLAPDLKDKEDHQLILPPFHTFFLQIFGNLKEKKHNERLYSDPWFVRYFLGYYFSIITKQDPCKALEYSIFDIKKIDCLDVWFYYPKDQTQTEPLTGVLSVLFDGFRRTSFFFWLNTVLRHYPERITEDATSCFRVLLIQSILSEHNLGVSNENLGLLNHIASSVMIKSETCKKTQKGLTQFLKFQLVIFSENNTLKPDPIRSVWMKQHMSVMRTRAKTAWKETLTPVLASRWFFAIRMAPKVKEKNVFWQNMEQDCLRVLEQEKIIFFQTILRLQEHKTPSEELPTLDINAACLINLLSTRIFESLASECRSKWKTQSNQKDFFTTTYPLSQPQTITPKTIDVFKQQMVPKLTELFKKDDLDVNHALKTSVDDFFSLLIFAHTRFFRHPFLRENIERLTLEILKAFVHAPKACFQENLTFIEFSLDFLKDYQKNKRINGEKFLVSTAKKISEQLKAMHACPGKPQQTRKVETSLPEGPINPFFYDMAPIERELFVSEKCAVFETLNAIEKLGVYWEIKMNPDLKKFNRNLNPILDYLVTLIMAEKSPRSETFSSKETFHEKLKMWCFLNKDKKKKRKKQKDAQDASLVIAFLLQQSDFLASEESKTTLYSIFFAIYPLINESKETQTIVNIIEKEWKKQFESGCFIKTKEGNTTGLYLKNKSVYILIDPYLLPNKEMIEQEKAAQNIQKLWALSQLKNQKNLIKHKSSLLISRFFSFVSKRKRDQSITNKVITIQSKGRSFLERKKLFLVVEGFVRLQSWIRLRQAMHSYRKKRTAAQTIQKRTTIWFGLKKTMGLIAQLKTTLEALPTKERALMEQHLASSLLVNETHAKQLKQVLEAEIPFNVREGLWQFTINKKGVVISQPGPFFQNYYSPMVFEAKTSIGENLMRFRQHIQGGETCAVPWVLLLEKNLIKKECLHFLFSISQDPSTEQLHIKGPFFLKLLGMMNDEPWVKSIPGDCLHMLVVTKSIPSAIDHQPIKERHETDLFKAFTFEIEGAHVHITCTPDFAQYNITNSSPFNYCTKSILVERTGQCRPPEESIDELLRVLPKEYPKGPPIHHIKKELSLLVRIISREKCSELMSQIQHLLPQDGAETSLNDQSYSICQF